MGMIKKTLHETKWVSLMMLDGEDIGGPYIYSHETRCAGHIVSVLPCRNPNPFYPEAGITEFLIRSEVTPCWGMDQRMSSVTGGCETYAFGSDYTADAMRELKEEAGYSVLPMDLIPLGYCRGTKSSDTIYHLYTANLTGFTPEETSGDGTKLESMAECTWVDENSLIDAQDPMISMCYMRMKLMGVI